MFGKYTGYDSNGLEFKSGYTINASASPITTIDYTYSSYDDTTTFWIGLFMTIISSLGFIIVGTSNRGGKR